MKVRKSSGSQRYISKIQCGYKEQRKKHKHFTRKRFALTMKVRQQGEACNSLRGNLGLVFKRCGEYTKAEKCSHDALKINKGIGNKLNEAKDYANYELRIILY